MSLLGRSGIDSGYFVNFNQDVTSLAVGSKRGYTFLSLTSVSESGLEEIHRCLGEDICMVERLFSSSLVAIVSINAPRKLRVCHFKKGTEICNYSYHNTILAVKLNRTRLVVCLEESLHIHNLKDMKVAHTIRDTPPNPHGICALSAHDQHCYLAYPGSARIGEVQVFDAANFHAKIMIPAHESSLAAIAFSQSGLEVATASEKGTVIRVFSVQDGSKLFEFRRGVKRCVSIASLSFSTCSKYLCCSSNTETVHIFALEKIAAENRDNGQSQGAGGGDWMGYLSKTVSSYLPLALPSQVADVFTQGRAFATAVLPTAGLRHTCVIATIERSLKLLVASQDGFLHVYQIAAVEGGDCKLVIKHDLRNFDNTELTTIASQEQESAPIIVPTNEPPGTTYASAVRTADFSDDDQ